MHVYFYARRVHQNCLISLRKTLILVRGCPIALNFGMGFHSKQEKSYRLHEKL